MSREDELRAGLRDAMRDDDELHTAVYYALDDLRDEQEAYIRAHAGRVVRARARVLKPLRATKEGDAG